MTEDQLEQETLGWLQEVGYHKLCGYDIAPEGPNQERADYLQPVLIERLRSALARFGSRSTLGASQHRFTTRALGVSRLLAFALGLPLGPAEKENGCDQQNAGHQNADTQQCHVRHALQSPG